MTLDDFCIFILSHKRPDRVRTYDCVRRSGYTGRIFIVIDDEDDTAAEYKARYGEQVIQFVKSDYDSITDRADNHVKRNSVVWARNACWDIAQQVGVKCFLVLDDDYSGFAYRLKGDGTLGKCVNIRRTFDQLCILMAEYQQCSGALSVAFAQGGEMIGGAFRDWRTKRKVMNSFFCSTNRPFRYIGRMNDDVNTYVRHGYTGGLFLTIMNINLWQADTQAQTGGLTDMYLEHGTYVKSFTTTMIAPSCSKVTSFGVDRHRIHHKVNWNATAPKILREHHRKPRLD